LPELHPTALKLADRLHAAGLPIEPVELEASTRTAADAAAAVGSELGQIVKSVVLVDGAGAPVLCLCAGDRMIDLASLGDRVRMARGNEVRDFTGFAIGGVPPLGHDRPLRTVIDRSLTRFATVWCAAGTPNAVFEVDVQKLLAAMPDADLRDVVQEPA
jgi:prolyl-tRNA editing enzyme YbaK/EbsC (Cys-tRNA(Pro) deacylase)